MKYLTKCNCIVLVLTTSVLVFVNYRHIKFTAHKEPQTKQLYYEEIQTKCKYGERGPRILCAVFIHQSFHKTRVQPVHETWGKR